MSLLVFSDTSTLLSLGLCGLEGRLRAIVGDAGRWTGGVERECRRKEDELEFQLPGLADRVGFQLSIVELVAEELSAAYRLRQGFVKPGDHREAHIGESETLTVVQRRRWKAVFATEDADAWRRSDGQPQGIDTWDLLGLGLKKSVLSEGDLWAARRTLRKHGRLRRSEFLDPEVFRAWLATHR